mgnify:FL=1
MAVKESTSPIAISARLGDLLVSEGLLTYEQLNECVTEQKKDGSMLSAVIMRKGYLASEKLVEFVATQCGFKFVRMSERGAIKSEVLKMVPEKLVRQKLLLPIAFADEQLTVAMSDPLNIMAVDEIKITTGLKVNVVITPEAELRDAIERFYGDGSSAKKAAEDLKKKAGETGETVVEEAKKGAPEGEEDDGVTISKETRGASFRSSI